MKPKDLKPIQKLAKATASCSTQVSALPSSDLVTARGARAEAAIEQSDQAAAYGACINAKYLEVEKDMCKEQFTAFKDCVTKAVSWDGPALLLPAVVAMLENAHDATPLGRLQMGRKW